MLEHLRPFAPRGLMLIACGSLAPMTGVAADGVDPELELGSKPRRRKSGSRFLKRCRHQRMGCPRMRPYCSMVRISMPGKPRMAGRRHGMSRVVP